MSINIEEMMNDIRTEIKEKGYSADMLSFDDVVASINRNADTVYVNNCDSKFSVNDYNSVVSYLNAAQAVPVSMPLPGNPIIVFIKKIIRRLTRVTIRPITEHQTEYNAYTARAFEMIGTYVEENLKTASGQLLEKIDMLELKLQTATKEIDRLNIKVAELEAKAQK